MSNNGDVSLKFERVNPPEIKWDEGKNKGMRTGSFEVNGKKYVITIRSTGEDVKMDEITRVFDKIGKEQLSQLSGHTIKTTPEDLRQKKIVLLDTGEKKEVVPEKESPLHTVASSICEEFLNIYGIDKTDQDEWHFELPSRQILLNKIDDLKNKEKINENTQKEIVQKLGNIEKLLVSYKRGENEFYEGLANCLTDDGKVKGSDGEKIDLLAFLNEVSKNLLPPGQFVQDRFIEGYLKNLVQSNNDFVGFSPSRYSIQSNENDPIQNAGTQILPLEIPKNSNPTKVLIPVNIDKNHWILYCFDNTNSEKPVLYRADSYTQTTAQHLTKNTAEEIVVDDNGIPKNVNNSKLELLKKMEEQIKADLKQELKLDQKVNIEVKDQKVIQQVNNNCAMHVCKNAEWFLDSEQKKSSIFNVFSSKGPNWNPENLKPKDFGEFRLDLLLKFLHPKTPEEIK